MGKAPSKSTDVAVIGELLQRIDAAGELTALDPEAISEQITLRILESGTAEEVLSGVSTVKSEKVLGLPMMIHGVHFNESNLKDGEGVYAIIDGTIAGKSVAVTCGSRTVLAQLFRLKELKAYPLRVRLTESLTKTASGFYPMQLEACPDDAPDVPIPASALEEASEEEPF